MAIQYICQFCDQENSVEDHKAGEMRDCRYCKKVSIVPGGQKMKVAISKTCPYCAEKDLQPEAVICKHCGKKLDGGGSGCLLYSTIFCLIIGALLFPPLILPGIALAVVWFILRAV